MGCGAAEATGLGFVCFVVINLRVLFNRVDLGFFCFINVPILLPSNGNPKRTDSGGRCLPKACHPNFHGETRLLNYLKHSSIHSLCVCFLEFWFMRCVTLIAASVLTPRFSPASSHAPQSAHELSSLSSKSISSSSSPTTTSSLKTSPFVSSDPKQSNADMKLHLRNGIRASLLSVNLNFQSMLIYKIYFEN
mgnify:CR=1 FL=1